MANNNSFLENTSLYFDKVMQKAYVEKKHILALKKQFKTLKDTKQYPMFFRANNNMLNQITTLSNNIKGKQSVGILQKVYDNFIQLTPE